MSARRGTAIVTGAGRAWGIAAGIAPALAADGRDLVLAHRSGWDVEEAGAGDRIGGRPLFSSGGFHIAS